MQMFLFRYSYVTHRGRQSNFLARNWKYRPNALVLRGTICTSIRPTLLALAAGLLDHGKGSLNLKQPLLWPLQAAMALAVSESLALMASFLLTLHIAKLAEASTSVTTFIRHMRIRRSRNSTSLIW